MEDAKRDIENLIVEQCGVPISLIQRRWRMKYSAVQSLMDEWAAEGRISPPDEHERRMPTGALLDRIFAVPGPQWLPLRLYVRRLYQVTLFIHENLEEGHGSNTDAINLMRPVPKLGAMQIRPVLEDLLRSGASPIQAAHDLHEWFLENEHVEAPRALWTVLEREFAGVNRPNKTVRERSEMIERAFLRTARYIRERCEENPHSEDSTAHSRIFEHFIPEAFVPVGRAEGLVGKGWGEHVVPCAYLRNQALRYIEAGWADAQVAQFLRRCLAIVSIPYGARERLDRTSELNLKFTMPEGWDPLTGDVFVRLHLAGVRFSMPIPS